MRLIDVAGEVAQEPLQHVRGTGQGDWHRVVVHIEHGEFIKVVVNHVGQIDQQVSTAIDCQRHPRPMRLPRGRDGAVNLGRPCEWNGDIRFTGGRVDVLVSSTRGLSDELVVDQQARSQRHRSHVGTSDSVRHSSSTRSFCRPISSLRVVAFAQP